MNTMTEMNTQRRMKGGKKKRKKKEKQDNIPFQQSGPLWWRLLTSSKVADAAGNQSESNPLHKCTHSSSTHPPPPPNTHTQSVNVNLIE
jgi:hypothetical protein